MQIHATLKPNSKHREEVIVNDDESLTIFTKSPAVEGRANEAAVKLVAKLYKVSKSSVRLVHGHTSKHKVFKVDEQHRLTDNEIVTVILPIISK
ncbi:MAG TPA: DUF167 domain-containing protein [Candidatus Saccharibacteria bacterium]|nr:DUF167 domain-containing protein [Candidatus Saccharibacteria bacterium]